MGSLRDPKSVAIAAAEEYAFYAGLVSISLIVAAILIFLLFRSDVRASAVAAATLCVHPLWTVTEVWHDNGATLRLASTVWIFFGCVAIFAALFSVYRRRSMPRGRLNLRFTIMSLLMLASLVAIVLVLVRPPLSDEIPVSRSLPLLGLMVALIIGMAPAKVRPRAKRGVQVTIPPTYDTVDSRSGVPGAYSNAIVDKPRD